MKPRHDREQALRAYDDESLKAGFKIAAGLPMASNVEGKSREYMISYILRSEERKRRSP